MNENRFIGRDLLPSTIDDCACEIEKIMVEESTKLLIVFESIELKWGELAKVEPFYVASHDYMRDGPEPDTPERINEYLKENKWNHFVWLPRWMCQGDIYHYTIRYAHELQHYRQVMYPDIVRPTCRYLSDRRAEGVMPSMRIDRDCDELDADVAAMKIFEEIHGKDELEAYIIRESKSPELENYLRKLREHINRLASNATSA